MNESNGVPERSGPAVNADQNLDATVRWLRGLSAAEMGQLRQAIADHDAESLAMFAIRFATCLDLTRRF
jgi:hypothetical protein